MYRIVDYYEINIDKIKYHFSISDLFRVGQLGYLQISTNCTEGLTVEIFDRILTSQINVKQKWFIVILSNIAKFFGVFCSNHHKNTFYGQLGIWVTIPLQVYVHCT